MGHRYRAPPEMEQLYIELRAGRSSSGVPLCSDPSDRGCRGDRYTADAYCTPSYRDRCRATHRLELIKLGGDVLIPRLVQSITKHLPG